MRFVGAQRVFVFLLLSVVSLVGYSDIGKLEKGVGVTTKNFSQLVATEPSLSVAREAHRTHDAGFVYGFLKSETGVVYSISREPRLFATSFSDRDMLGSWPLTRWEGEYLEEEVKDRYSEYLLDADRVDIAVRGRNDEVLPAFGCLPENPLRYGDFTGDGENELVVFLGRTLVVFSPKHKEIVFSTRLGIADWLDRERTKEVIEHRRFGDRPQYHSRLLETARREFRELALAGYRGHAKIFSGSMSEDSIDVVLWRKLYESRLEDDPVDGFEFVKDTLLHYEIDGGRFIRQETPESVIKDWLSEKGKSWADGFPRYSECEGEEGQLIPEMHDPLLNDPEVLEGVDPETMTLIENEKD